MFLQIESHAYLQLFLICESVVLLNIHIYIVPSIAFIYPLLVFFFLRSTKKSQS